MSPLPCTHSCRSKRTFVVFISCGLAFWGAWRGLATCLPSPVSASSTRRRQSIFLHLAGLHSFLPSPCGAREAMTDAATAALLENGPQLQRAADELVLELRPSILSGDWRSTKAALMGADRDILQPVERISIQNAKSGSSTKELKQALTSLRAAAVASDSAKALQAWDASAKVVNSVMAYANEAMAGNEQFKDVQQFALVTEDPEKYLFDCWDVLVSGTEVESEFREALAKAGAP
eukprot:TRINITY_DN81815_c0_g1_i1.p2 TRINITY_DN81815_c0_g1~~TRINITY_DN81815_c0_g1_i1.p2  ORF type:complete len:235 (+),score=53.67 TRINITY_DN81815_c0_g1_i1:40-744(+)